jgi:hypothetical protein
MEMAMAMAVAIVVVLVLVVVAVVVAVGEVPAAFRLILARMDMGGRIEDWIGSFFIVVV